MIVSNFEVGVRRRLRGIQHTRYRLQITNLEDKEIEFLVECHADSMGGAVSTSGAIAALLEATVTTGWTHSQPFRRRGQVFVHGLAFQLASKASAVYELQVRSRDEALLLGHIALRVPPTRAEGRRFLAMAQQGRPVPVLLHASREDYREAFSAGGLDTEGRVLMRVPVGDWLSTQSIEISTGRAENQIEPEGFGTLGNLRDFQRAWQALDLEPRSSSGALLLPEEERIPALLDLLAALERDEEGLRVINELLAELNADVRVCEA